MYLNRFIACRDTFERYGRDLTRAFKTFQDQGYIEIIASCATHGYLPLMDISLASARAQVRVGTKVYEETFGRKALGFWLPECGYQPGQDTILKDCGIMYFFTELHAILHGSPRPKYGIYAPVYCKSGVACFGRDWESAKQVWSSIEGYPGDYWYREFYRDIGFDLDYDYIRPYIHTDGIRINTGIKYYRITGSEDKQPYNPHKAGEKAAEQAGNFMFNRERQIEYLYEFLKKKPILVAPYDAELFGHWWFEGPQWLEFLIRKIYFDHKAISLVSASDYLNENPRNQVITPSLSSWGWKGYSEMWLQGANDWIYRHLHEASRRMSELVRLYPNEDNVLVRRALDQALRELLLAQSSDWAFIMGTATHTNYAIRRTKEHILRFTTLYEQIKSRCIDPEWLKDIEYKDNIFPNIDYRAHQ
jgi:1,4-alpha-glucan branching enzyme